MFASALTALVMVLLSIPFHMARWQWMAGTGQGHPQMPGAYPWMHGMMMQQAQAGGWPIIAWILLAIAAVMVCAGVTGAIFAAIYNAFAPRET